jgi:hypothetical protein
MSMLICLHSFPADFSFPLYQGFTLEDATGLTVKGDLDIHSDFATSLPTSHPSL